MKKLIFSLLLSFITFSLAAQLTRVRKESDAGALQQPLIIVNSIETDFNNMLVKPDRIESITVLKDSASVAMYGEKAKYGAVIIHTKKGSELVQFPELIDLYNIPEQDRKLRVCLDHVLLKDPTRLIADKNDINKVEVITDTLWYSATQAGPEERYINIEMKKAAKE